MRIAVVIISLSALLSACAMTPEQSQALAESLNSGVQNMERERQRVQQPPQAPQRPMNCTTTYSGGMARTNCW